MDILFDILVLFFLDVVLSVDNAVLIAATTRELEGKTKKTAQILGGLAAVLMRLIFVVLILLVLTAFEGVILMYIIGGGILVFLGLMITGPEKEKSHKDNPAKSVMKAMILIIAGDIMMSFDNAFIIADISMGMEIVLGWKIAIIALALLLSLVIILFFASTLTRVMKNNPWIIYIAGWLLVSVGIEMMLKDQLFNIDHSYHLLVLFSSYALGGILTYGKYYLFDRNKKEVN